MEADLEHVAANANQLNDEDITEVLRLLEYFEELFVGTIGHFDTEIVDLEIHPDSKSFNCKYYPVLRINKETFCKELQCLVKIGLLTTVQYSTPVIIFPKKEDTVRFIIDYCRINQKLFRNPYPLPRICETMQKLKGF